MTEYVGLSFLNGKADKCRCSKADKEDYLSHFPLYVSAFAISLEAGNVFSPIIASHTIVLKYLN